MEEEVIALGYQKRRSFFRKELLYPAFTKNWEHKLVSKQGQIITIDKNNALTYPNVHQIIN